eukprot:jgi/Tetstr1/435422/TSEL_024330.t1
MAASLSSAALAFPRSGLRLAAGSAPSSTRLLRSAALRTLPPRCAASSSAEAETKEAKGRSGGVTGPAKGFAQKIDVNPPRGTRDFAPDDMRLRNWLFGHFAEVSKAFGFEQIDAPVLESEELFVRKAGEEITDQLYNFEDKGGRRMSLRPEITPSLARLVLQKGKGLPMPAKWWVIGQCWRYERTTRGRRREHYQWNMDIIGVQGMEAEAELLAAITTFFQRVGLTSADVGIKVNSRKVLQAVITSCGVPEELFGAVCVIVDKMEKIPREKVVEELGKLGVDDAAIDRILSSMAVTSLEELEALVGTETEAIADMRYLFSLAEGYGFADWLQFDASVVRGLAYYTGTVFEGFDRAGELRAICGGGRYDRLLSTFGGEDQPATGFGFGDAVIVELLKDKGLLPDLGHQVDDMVMVMGDGVGAYAAGVAAKLRASGRSVELVLETNKKMKWAFKQAERCGAGRLITVGSREMEAGVVRVKDLGTREEEEVSAADL